MSRPASHQVNGALFFTLLEGILITLHERGAVNEDALLGLFKDLNDRKPLTIDALSAVFGIDPIYAALKGAGFVQ